METKAVPTGKDDLQIREAAIAGAALWVWLRRVDKLAGPPESRDTKGSTTEDYHCTYDDPEHLTELRTFLRMHQKKYKYSAYRRIGTGVVEEGGQTQGYHIGSPVHLHSCDLLAR